MLKKFGPRSRPIALAEGVRGGMDGQLPTDIKNEKAGEREKSIKF